MLALKRVLAGLGPAGLYVFDEVDAGVGGAVAEVIGRKIREVSKHHQVLCITHLPQIAVFADAHFHVSKQRRGGPHAQRDPAPARRTSSATRSRACWAASRSPTRPGPPPARCCAQRLNNAKAACDRLSRRGAFMDTQALKEAFAQRGIRRVKVGGFDIDGVLRGKYISLEKFWSAVEKGFGFCDVIFGWDFADVLYDNAEVTGWHTGYPDMLAKIDLVDVPGAAVGAEHGALPRRLLDRHEHAASGVPAQPAQDAWSRARGSRLRAAVRGASSSSGCSARRRRACARRASATSTPLSPGMFGYSWVREGQHARSDRGRARADGRRTTSTSRACTPRPARACTRRRSATRDPVRAADMAALFKTTMKVLCARHGCTRDVHGEVEPEPARLERPHPPEPVEPRRREEPVRRRRAPSTGSRATLGEHYLGGLLALIARADRALLADHQQLQALRARHVGAAHARPGASRTAPARSA